MHAAWSAKGAQEFVPGGGVRDMNQGVYRRQLAPGFTIPGSQHHMFSTYPGVNMYPTQDQWPSAMPVPNPWQQTAPGMGMRMMFPKDPVQHIAPESIIVLHRVALWNLSPSYSTGDLKNELIEIDLEPDRVEKCSGVQGAYLLWFSESWVANALEIVLDNTNDILQVTNPDSCVRALKCDGSPSKILSSDMPHDLRKAVAREDYEES